MPNSDSAFPFSRYKPDFADLNGQSVQFNLLYVWPASPGTLQATDHYEGSGRFVILEQRGDLAQIAIDVPTGNRNNPTYQRLPLWQKQVDRIERHPDQRQASFRLFDNV